MKKHQQPRRTLPKLEQMQGSLSPFYTPVDARPEEQDQRERDERRRLRREGGSEAEIQRTYKPSRYARKMMAVMSRRDAGR